MQELLFQMQPHQRLGPEFSRRRERQTNVPQVRTHIVQQKIGVRGDLFIDRKSTRLNSSHSQISYAVFCLKKKKTTQKEERLLHCKIARAPGRNAHTLTSCYTSREC